jgi:16S rRNA (guanine1207-N2)-methyltransferase
MLLPLLSEQALIAHLESVQAARPLVISPGRGQAAWHIAELLPGVTSTLWYADLHKATLAEELAQAEQHPIRVACAADLPTETFDFAAVVVMARDEAEWTRDILQQAHQRLQMGGTLIASVDNPRDQWLAKQLREMFGKIVSHPQERAMVYVAKKTKELKRVRDFSCEFVFRDDERLIHAISRPGVFSHRHLDPGARQLLRMVDVAADQRVMDLGCGCGAVGLASALRAPGVQVYSVDSHARAIECTQRGAELNKIGSLKTIWNANGQFAIDEPIDVVLANPPYYGDFAVAEHFLTVTQRVLRPGGAALFVTKFPSWYAERMSQMFCDVEVVASGKYYVACGRQR